MSADAAAVVPRITVSDSNDDSSFETRELERQIFAFIDDGDRDALSSLFSGRSDLEIPILQLLLDASRPNADRSYHHDSEVAADAEELLGISTDHLNAIHVACFLGDEEIALDILDFVARVTEDIQARKILYEFMSRVWGDGNTVLHLASFLGMSQLVKRLLELGANRHRKNGRKYKPVDCADDDETRVMFGTVGEVTVSPTARETFCSTSMVPSGFRRVTSVQDISGGLLTAPKPIQCPSPPLSSPSLSTLARHGKSRSLDDPLCASKASQELSTAVAVSSRYSVPLKTAPIAPSFALADCPPSSTGHSTPSRQQEQNTRPRDRQRRIRFDRATLILELCQQGSLDASTRATDSLEALLNSADAGEPATPSTKVDILAIRTPQQSLSPLHLASTHGHFELVKSLIGRIGNADAVLARDAEGWTPLHCAAAEGKVDIVRELLRSAVEGGCGRELAEARNGDGETASEVADARCRGEVEALLAEAASQAHPRPTEITREGGRNEDSAGCTATADAQTATVRIPSVHQPPTTSASTPLDLSCASDPDFSSVGKSNMYLKTIASPAAEELTDLQHTTMIIPGPISNPTDRRTHSPERLASDRRPNAVIANSETTAATLTSLLRCAGLRPLTVVNDGTGLSKRVWSGGGAEEKQEMSLVTGST